MRTQKLARSDKGILHSAEYSPILHSAEYSPILHSTEYSPILHSTEYSPIWMHAGHKQTYASGNSLKLSLLYFVFNDSGNVPVYTGC